MEDMTDANYNHVKNVWKNLSDYHDFYVQIDSALPAHTSENFRNKRIETYELDSANFLSALGLAWKSCLKKTKLELELLTDIDMLKMVEKGISSGICHAIHLYAKSNNKHMKDYNKNKE